MAPSGDRRNCDRGDEVSFVAEELKGIFDPARRAVERRALRAVRCYAQMQLAGRRGQGRRKPAHGARRDQRLDG